MSPSTSAPYVKMTTVPLGGCSTVDVDVHSAQTAGKWWREHRAQGRTLGLIDTLIAAAAHAHGAIVLTANGSDFPMSEVQVELLPSRPPGPSEG